MLNMLGHGLVVIICLVGQMLVDRSKTTTRIAGAAVLAPLSVLLQALPPIFITPWGMRIDLVAVPWVVCWMFFGLRTSLLCILVSAPLVGALGPFAGGWVGAIMKSTASVWIILVPAFLNYEWNKIGSGTNIWRRFVPATICAILVRDVATLLFNLYFALPVFYGMSPDQVISFFGDSRFQSFPTIALGIIGVGAYIVEIVLWNTVQGFIDAYASFVVGSIAVKRLSGAKR
jgi:riboflavin transporter FmnP